MAKKVDWNEVKTEYLTTDTTYRKLAKKYDIPLRTIGEKAKREKWVELRKQHCDRIVTKSVEKTEKIAIDYKSSLYSLAFKVAQQLNDMTDQYTMPELLGIGLKPRDITGAIKDLEDALHVKSDKDLREQEARIEKLKRDVSDDQIDNKIQVVISSNLEEYSK